MKTVTRSKLDRLHTAAQAADAELTRLRSEWVAFGLAHGAVGRAAAKDPGNPGHELLWSIVRARTTRDAAAAALADARLALL